MPEQERAPGEVRAIDGAIGIENVARTLSLLHENFVDNPSFYNFSESVGDILCAVLPEQIKNLDRIGISLAGEFDKAEYQPVLLEIETSEEAEGKEATSGQGN